MSLDDLKRTNELSAGNLPAGEELNQNIKQRRQMGSVWYGVLMSTLIFSFIILAVLLVSIINDAFGLVAIQNETPITEVVPEGQELGDLSRSELMTIIEEELPGSTQRILEREQQLSERSNENLRQVVREEVLNPQIEESWPLLQSIFNRGAIEAEVAERMPNGELRWDSWLDTTFLSTTMSSTPAEAGIRTAIYGTLWVIFITMLVAFPLGVGAAIYLEEYAKDARNPLVRRINRIIQTNINNLAGVPSIIYGMLGLAIFVRAMQPFTSGAVFGLTEGTTDNGRTIIAAGMTLALLILPIIIINAQESIRAVPSSLRQASYGLGATKWQTIWNHVLPQAMGGVLTGTILSMSRAIGETAPLIVVGASTFITSDPENPFSKFTVLPIQIYNWAAQPDAQFRNTAAAAIIVLLVILLSLNAGATLLRNRFRGRV
jgi:phosphate transport system permease protein